VAFVPTMFAVSLLVFLMIELIPGDPTSMILGPEGTQEQRIELREQLGLDRPFYERAFDWYSSALRGDLGESLFLNQSVTEAILRRMPVTLSLSAMAMVFASLVGVSAGIVAAVKRGQALDWIVMFGAMLGLSIPVFWLALNMILLFSVNLGWFPTGGYVPLTESPIEYLRHLFLPALALGLVHTAVVARMSRSAMLEVLRQDYVRTARAKGLQGRDVVLSHALRNSLIPVVTVLGIGAGELLAGSVITETVFNLPGVGRVIVDAVKRRDYPMVQGGILFVTLSYLIINLIVDVTYAWINPRIRHG
jgi:peptide/nickel transport system permease protein